VKNGCTPGDSVPYLEYAKAQDADFKVWDIYGIPLLHLLLERGDKNPGIVQDLNWVLENTNVKDLINALCREEGNPAVERDTEGPRSDNSSIAGHSRATWTNEPYRGLWCTLPWYFFLGGVRLTFVHFIMYN
jgi:hypothetical protein